MKKLIYFFVFVAGVAIGLLLRDIPYYELDEKVRVFEVLNFCVLLIFGYYFQVHQRKKSAHTNVMQKTFESVLAEISLEIVSITTTIEESLKSKTFSDDDKKLIHLKLKLLSMNIYYINTSTKASDDSPLIKSYNLYKDIIINDNFSLSSFEITISYLKEVANNSILLKNEARKIITDHISSI